MAYEHIIYQPGKVARIILNRPKYLNAQSYRMLEELDSAIKEAVRDPACGVIVLSGLGRAFSVGHDIGTEEDKVYREQHGYVTRNDLSLFEWTEGMRKLYVDFQLTWRNAAKPTIAMVHGYCIFGGWMVAAAMDVIFAAEDAQFLPGFVEYFSVPWDIGPRRAKEILFEHRFMTAREAYDYGFVNRIFSAEALEQETLAYAERVADNYLSNTVWVRLCKFSINHMEETMGLNAEIETSFNNFCLMTTMGARSMAEPSKGGFARTDVAKKNLALSRPWLAKEGLDEKQ
ncbi:MAG: enoyl-CoA hydratase/isomerase family protein [Deltaproteobacteria bacterium]|nr:enoyl-CoA hydratase/isomerase family protein [Deltaproteobacteria bacterium]